VRNEPERVDAYLAALPDEQRTALERVRATIRRVVPGADEGIAYQMPAFYFSGRYLVSYAAFKSHLSFFPASGTVQEKLADELRAHFSGKGTIQFTPDEPIPDDLIEEIVRVRLDELAAGS
jgi:uncharacterized protein YdhG (YjbR/CyaY superfamily)